MTHLPKSAALLLYVHLVREPTIGLIKWLRPKGLKVCFYVEKCAEFTKQTLKNGGWYTNVLCATEYPRGRQYFKLMLKWGVSLWVYNLNNVIFVVKYKYWQQTIYLSMFNMKKWICQGSFLKLIFSKF